MTTEMLWTEMLDKRNRKLEASDWTQFADSPLSAAQKSAWASYRQQLRDIPQTFNRDNFLEVRVWPTPPNT